MDEPVATLESPPPDPPTPDPQPEPTPPQPDESAQLREEVARLRGQVEVLTRPAPVAAPPTSTDSPEAVIAAHARGEIPYGSAAVAIDRLYAEGKITDRTRVEAITDLRTRQNLRDHEATQQRARGEQAVKERMRDLMRAHPDLRNAQSPLIADVQAELAHLAELGHDPDALATQVVAIEKVTSRATVPSTHEFERRRVPAQAGAGAGGPGGGGDRPTDKPRGQQLYERLTEEAKAVFLDQARGDLAKVYRTLSFADEGMLTRAGRFAR